ncbi:MAG: pyridoxal-phosphate dependent enzyme [Ignavibacteriaceae bacterium]|nr:pyridoxal-phosphate dependent enzyme [Ignavibacteriaceae bacterium]
MKVYNSILEAFGNTPLIKLNNINRGLKPAVYAKLESANPGGSVKDRIGISMIEDAEKTGKIKPGGTLIEATSGNTGIGLALAATVKGYNTVFVVTDKVSVEKVNYLKALGAEVIVCPNSVKHDSPDYYINVAKRIAEETPNSLFMYQYSNPANPRIHYQTTGPEIWEQTKGKVTHFIAGIGTGGTISGVGKFLKEKNPDVKIIGADPFGSIFRVYHEQRKLTEGIPYLVEGIGQDCIPENVDFTYIDSIVNVSDIDSFDAARRLTREEGIFCGGSTGTIVHTALKLAENLTEKDVIVFIVCDTGERYLSKFHSEEWLREKRLLKESPPVLRELVYKKRQTVRRPIVSVHAKDTVKQAVAVFNKDGLSQLPVMDFGETVGSLREAKVMASLLENPALLESHIEDIMEPSFPCVDEKTDLHAVKKHLTESPAILVTEYGRIIEIITRYDILEFSDDLI